MLKDYPIKTFTEKQPELKISFMTGMKLTLLKFVMNSDEQNFLSNSLLGFQVQIGNTPYEVKYFKNLVTATQKDHHVIDINMPFQTQEDCIATIKIVDQNEGQNYSISMVYEIQPM